MRTTPRRRRGLSLLQTIGLTGTCGIVMLGGPIVFDDAEIRALVAESRVRMAAVGAGLEAYAVDWSIYPYDGYNHDGTSGGPHNYWYVPNEMTTPVAYVTESDLLDPFQEILRDPDEGFHWQWRQMRYTNIESTWGTVWDNLQTGPPGTAVWHDAIFTECGNWRLIVYGPDNLYGPAGGSSGDPWPGVTAYPALNVPYDPTNGTMSTGDIIRSQAAPQGYQNLPPLEE